jgi:rSAM/selenodomain-associated transferase 1
MAESMGDNNNSIYKSIMKDCCIIFFVKYPEKGKIKTRLAKSLDEAIVLFLYKNFVSDILSILNKSNFKVKIFFDPPKSIIKMKSWLGNYSYTAQKGNDLGEKMKNAFKDVFNENYNKAIIIGSDMPYYPKNIFNRSFKSLNNYQSVIGPSLDGGYYLLGFKKDTFLEKFFYNIQWSKESVFDSTMEIFKKISYKVKILEYLNDIDTIDDLHDFFIKNKNSKFKNSNTIKYIVKSKIFN